MGNSCFRPRSTPPGYPERELENMGSNSLQQICPPSSEGAHFNSNQGERLYKKYAFIGDNYKSLEEVTQALREAGLESSNLIIGIDFTKSNEWTGKKSFNGKSLHSISRDTPNPYEQAISIIGKTLSGFDEDNLIPCFGFGEASTHDHSVFSFYPDQRPCVGFEEVLSRYKEIVPHLHFSGPTSFAPIIEAACGIVEQSGGQYHVLLVIADGQVTRSVDTDDRKLSPQEQKTIDAIANASNYALSIVLVGVGDGPWDTMKKFDDCIPKRRFDNFQFVNFTTIMSTNMPIDQKEVVFALAALMEIPFQYKAAQEFNILNQISGKVPRMAVLPTPLRTLTHDSSMPGHAPSTSMRASNQNLLHAFGSSNNWKYDGFTGPEGSSGESSVEQLCPICLTRPRDLAFGCGHQTCRRCGENLEKCPLCRRRIDTRVRLF